MWKMAWDYKVVLSIWTTHTTKNTIASSFHVLGGFLLQIKITGLIETKIIRVYLKGGSSKDIRMEIFNVPTTDNYYGYLNYCNVSIINPI